MNLGNNVRKLREFHNFTQEFMAEQLGCSQKTYSNIEKAGNEIKFSVLENIAAVLKIGVRDILELDAKFDVHAESHSQSADNIISPHRLAFDLYEKLIKEKDLRIQDLLSSRTKSKND